MAANSPPNCPNNGTVVESVSLIASAVVILSRARGLTKVDSCLVLVHSPALLAGERSLQFAMALVHWLSGCDRWEPEPLNRFVPGALGWIGLPDRKYFPAY